jgi:repressor of nif and glnA expression
VTAGQREVLAALTTGPLVARDVGLATRNTDYGEITRYHLRRAEDAGLVRRLPGGRNGAAKWELTQAGRQALATTT